MTPKKYLLISLVILLASLPRFYRLAALPAGFHNDEASFWYNTQLLVTTGEDEDGRSWPAFLNSYIDPKPALISYLQAPFFIFFGSGFGVSRLPFAIMGVLSIGLIYRLTERLSSNKKLSLFATVLLSVSPWHIMVSRATQEVMTAFFLGRALLPYLLRAETASL